MGGHPPAAGGGWQVGGSVGEHVVEKHHAILLGFASDPGPGWVLKRLRPPLIKLFKQRQDCSDVAIVERVDLHVKDHLTRRISMAISNVRAVAVFEEQPDHHWV
eukprot:CAMPEP_0117656900 /NCGR_PEP_ID=MMETSP0804-20121206/5047_1 /TAXON_ID=1074897 /ORGANISM="Tetraselmis astigmatica, Strain CCMP880" /LENGTH=103 /DNA_ID=CAMNT_0005463325 /DNA_START=895 /DNA_END=1206 /DNA_ORIENTATION=+